MKVLNEGNSAFYIVTDIQKVFDTVDQNILMKKLDHYGVRGISNKCFE